MRVIETSLKSCGAWSSIGDLVRNFSAYQFFKKQRHLFKNCCPLGFYIEFESAPDFAGQVGGRALEVYFKLGASVTAALYVRYSFVCYPH